MSVQIVRTVADLRARVAAWRAEGAEVAHSPAAALALAGPGEVAVIGGAEVFALFAADRIELTEVHAAPHGDAIVPAFGVEWHEVAREDFVEEAGRPAYSFVTLERVR